MHLLPFCPYSDTQYVSAENILNKQTELPKMTVPGIHIEEHECIQAWVASF